MQRKVERESSHWLISLQLPFVTKRDEEDLIENMRSVFSHLYYPLRQTGGVLSLEGYRVDEYLRLQLVVNDLSLLPHIENAFSYIPGVRLLSVTSDALDRFPTLIVKKAISIIDTPTITESPDFFAGLLHVLSSFQGNDMAGFQIILRAVDKRELLYNKSQKLQQKIKLGKSRDTTIHEKLRNLEQKQQEPHFKVKIIFLATTHQAISQLHSTLGVLAVGANRFRLSNESIDHARKRYIPKETPLSSIPLLRGQEGAYLTARDLSYFIHPTSFISGSYAPHLIKEIEAPRSFLTSMGESLPIGTIQNGRGISQPLYFPRKNFERHLYLIGKTGRGKSSLLLSLISSLAEKKKTIFVFDPHGDLVSDVKRVTDSSSLMTISETATKTFTFNPLFAFQKTESQKAAILDSILSIIEQETKETGTLSTGVATTSRIKSALALCIQFPDAYYHYLTNHLHLSEKRAEEIVYERQLTLNDLPYLMTREMEYFPLLEEIYAASDTTLGFYVRRQLETHLKQTMVTEAVQSRLEQLLHPTLSLIYEGNKFSLSEVSESKNVFLIPLKENTYGSKGAGILLQLLFSQLWLAKREKNEGRSETYLFIDEFQKAQIQAIPEIIAEGRKYQLYLTVSHQQLGQLRQNVQDAILGNMGTLISFTVGADKIGAQTLAPFFGDEVGERALTNLPPFTAYMRTEGDSSKPVVTLSFETNQAKEKGRNLVSKEVKNPYLESIQDIKKRLRIKQENPLSYFLTKLEE